LALASLALALVIAAFAMFKKKVEKNPGWMYSDVPGENYQPTGQPASYVGQCWKLRYANIVYFTKHSFKVAQDLSISEEEVK
jgi:hypothetical protein